MSRIAWNTAGSRFYEAGVDRGVLYLDSLAGIPWVGLISVDENPSGGEPKAYYIDGDKYLNLSSNEEFEASIKAFTYPVEFAECDGTARVRPGLFFGQQQRKSFGFSYRTMIGNDTGGSGSAYKIHLVYNGLATPSTKSVSTYEDSIQASDFTWDLTTKSRGVSGYKTTAHVVIDSRYTHPLTLQAVEDALYGSDSVVAHLPSPQELIDIFDVPVVFNVHDNGDGTYLIEGLDENILDIGGGKYLIDHPGVVAIDEDTYTISS